MNQRARVIHPGWAVTLQDKGRTGWRHVGVAACGHLDVWYAQAANVLAGNGWEDDFACLEVLQQGPVLECLSECLHLAVVGDASQMRWTDAGGNQRRLSAWQSFTLTRGERLDMGVVQGVVYLAVLGGWDAPRVLGSRATHLRTRMGGWDGDSLKAGKVMEALCPASDRVARRAAPIPRPSPILVRVMEGPQCEHFDAASTERFYAHGWRVTHERDRMGMRLEGPALGHLTARHAEIASEGVTLGSIQVPAGGQPVVLLADAQTVGGYPKIATVIQPDLRVLAQCRTGDVLQFVRVTQEQASSARAEARDHWLDWVQRVEVIHEEGDAFGAQSNAFPHLYSHNLISGFVAED